MNPHSTTQPSSNELLQVHQVDLTLAHRNILNRCSFSVEKGSITAMIGPNGAGKTSMFNVINGLYLIQNGQIFLDSDDITCLRPDLRYKRGIARTFQIPLLCHSMSVIDNLIVVARDQLGEQPWRAWFEPRALREQLQSIETQAMSILKTVKLDHLYRQAASDLSYGQQKLLEMSRALMVDSKLLLLDEPAAGIHPKLITELSRHICMVNERFGLTVLLIEHHMDMVAEISSHVLVLHEGALLCQGSYEHVRQDPTVLNAYLGGFAPC